MTSNPSRAAGYEVVNSTSNATHSSGPAAGWPATFASRFESKARGFAAWIAVGGLAALALAASDEAGAAPPKVTTVFPAGVARGQTSSLTVTGDFARWPVDAWVDRPGLTLKAAEKKGQLDATAAADAAPGVYWFRLFDAEGASAPRPLIVGTLKEVDEVEPNDAPDKPQTIDGPTVINGKLAKAGDVDSFAITLAAGQTLVASVDAHSSLGSPMDSVLQIARLDGTLPKEGQALGPFARRPDAFVLDQTDDEVGLDPRLVLTAPKDGTYLVRVFAFPTTPNSTIGLAGGDNFIYRLTITNGPFIDHALPGVVSTLPADADSTGVELFGWNLPSPAPRFVPAPADAREQSLPAIDRASQRAWLVGAAESFALAWSDAAAVVATPDSSVAQPQDVPLPVTVSGRIEAPRDSDAFRFAAKKGDKIRCAVEARSIGFALDPILQILDADGKVVTEVDDAKNERDADLTFTAPADGAFRLVVRDVHGHGGPRHVYRVTLAPVVPDFGLTLAADGFVIAAGKTLELPVTIDRQNGFGESIDLTVEGLPAGVTAAAARSEAKGDSAKAVKITLTADAAMIAAASGGPIRIVGKSAGDAPRVHVATFGTADPAARHRDAWLAVTK